MNDTLQVYRNSLLGSPLTSSSNHELANEYLHWKKSYTKSAYRSYKVWVHRFQEFVNKPPELMSHIDYAAFAHSLHGRFSSLGIQYALNIVHNYLRFYFEQGRLKFPLYLARVPRGFPNSHEAISEAEYQALIGVLRSQGKKSLRDLAIIMLLHDTGMRIGELVSLSVEDIEPDRSAVIRTEKTVRQRRVFWNPDTDNVLQQYLVARVNYGPADETDALFISDASKNGQPLTGRSIERVLKMALGKAGIERKLSPHSFRHAFIHRLAKLSVPDAIIAQLVGHSTPATIAHYTKLSRPELKDYAHKQLVFAADEAALAA